ncbi:MAG TPA: NAD-dependent epimerase/dehydratase family protein, partial [Chloroflexota bacterium]|nr:NAD-dependent epimerase/dehydratase family protein [Chloroflexota bacterium]
MRVLVTGGAGYIGSFTTRALREAGHDVLVFDNLSYGHREAIDAPLIVGDLADSAALDAALAPGCDAIVHFAAFIEAGESMIDASPFFQNNVANSINLLNAAARHDVQNLVFSSTAAVYGDDVVLPIKEIAETVPANVYGETKLLVERMLPWYERVHGIRSVALRYFNAAGGAPDGSMGQDHEPATHLITVAIKAALGKIERFPLYGT